MLIGVPGSGKSHWLNSLEKKCMDGETYLLFKGIPFLVVCPDTIRQSLGSISDQSQNVLVWKKAKDSVIGCLENGTSVILDATNVNTAYRRDFISGLPKCRMLAKIFHATPAVAWERVKKDLTLEVDRAAVPEETIYRMFGEFLYTVKVLSSEGFEIRGE
jgi:predicted kinase